MMTKKAMRIFVLFRIELFRSELKAMIHLLLIMFHNSRKNDHTSIPYIEYDEEILFSLQTSLSRSH